MTGVPIDRGWAWCVCLGAAVNLFFVTGGMRSIGLLFIEITEKFESSRTMTALTVGFLGAGFGIFSPIGNALGMRFSMRRVVCVGGFLAATSSTLTALAPNIYYIILVFGVLTGIGYGLMFGPSLVMIGMYFDKRRSLANGLAAAGGSLGQLVLPQLITLLIDHYAFSGCVLIIGAITFHSLPAAMLFRPLSEYRTQSIPDPEKSTVPNSIKNGIVSSTENNNIKVTCDLAADIDNGASNESETMQVENEAFHEKEQKVPLVIDKSSSVRSLHISEDNTPNMLNCSVTLSNGALNLHSNLSKSKPSLYASTQSIAAFQEVPPSVRMADQETDKNGDSKIRPTSPAIKKGFFSFIDFTLFKNPLFIIYVIGLTCGHGGYVNLCMFLPAYANEVGVARDKVALLLSVIGISDLIGRVLGGWFADLGLLKRSNIMAICLSFTGVCAILVPFLPVFEVFTALCIVIGLIGGVYVSLMAVVAIDFMGLHRLASSFGLAMMFLGLGSIPIPIVIGLMKDIAGTFGPAIQFCGALMAAGGTSFAFEPLARRCQNRSP